MYGNRAFYLLSLVVAPFWSPVFAENGCISLDDKIEANVFVPLRNKIHSTSSEYVKLRDIDYDLLSYGFWTRGGKLGDLSGFELTGQTNANSSTLCTQDGYVQILYVDFQFKELTTTFTDVSLHIPYVIQLGDTGAALLLQGSKLKLEATLTKVEKTQSTAEKCSVTLNSVSVVDWGQISISFNTGWLNWIAHFVLNILSASLLNILDFFGMNDYISSDIQTFLSPIVESNGQTICDLINQ